MKKAQNSIGVQKLFYYRISYLNNRWKEDSTVLKIMSVQEVRN